MKRERETDRNVDGRQGLIKTELHYWSGMRTQKDVFVCLLPPNNKNVHFELSNGQNIMPFLRQINAISYSVKYQSAFYGLQHLVICVWVCECERDVYGRGHLNFMRWRWMWFGAEARVGKMSSKQDALIAGSVPICMHFFMVLWAFSYQTNNE